MELFILSYMAAFKDEPKSNIMRHALKDYRRGIITLEELRGLFEELRRQ